MKFNNISYTSFLFVVVLFFPSLIFAPWTVFDPPKVPTDGIARNCPEWIQFNGFTLDNFEVNRKMAKKRSYKLDRQATTWAAMYAFNIGGTTELPDILPEDFCDSFGDENVQQKQFMALESERKTCDQWITLYRFSDDPDYNFFLAVSQKKKKMSAISFWAHMYWFYVAEFGMTKPLTPIEFCTKIGKSVGDDEEKRMSFMSENDTPMTCHEWIDLYEFTDNPESNLAKAINLRNESHNYSLVIHYFPTKYATKLLQSRLYGVARTCPEWIEFNGFTLDSYKENGKMARRRDTKLDKEATTWAAVYAFIMTGGIDRYDTLPEDFCETFGDENLQPTQFLALKNERKTCDKWITLYRFSDDFHNNTSLAVTQKQKRLPAISIWAHIYYLYITEFRMTKPLTPTAFCIKVGKSVGDDEDKRMEFMSENDTMLTCYAWIHLYEYTDDPIENYYKAFNNESQDYFLFVHYFPFNYAKKLLQEGSVDTIDILTPQVYCEEFNGEDAEPTTYELFYLGPRVRRAVI